MFFSNFHLLTFWHSQLHKLRQWHCRCSRCFVKTRKLATIKTLHQTHLAHYFFRCNQSILCPTFNHQVAKSFLKYPKQAVNSVVYCKQFNISQHNLPTTILRLPEKATLRSIQIKKLLKNIKISMHRWRWLGRSVFFCCALYHRRWKLLVAVRLSPGQTQSAIEKRRKQFING